LRTIWSPPIIIVELFASLFSIYMLLLQLSENMVL
jgi:hypothetical protein